ncbi:hypothetical protein [Streptomyces sp. NPDC045369]|uniref:DUF7848 domain-containing protein n=1 Tax=Streptomyces sp. NPDC045369 TaxID=3155732 RepID=UPI0033E278D5
MTTPNPIPIPSRDNLARLMRSRGRSGVLRMRSSGGSDAALNIPQLEGKPMATSAPVPTRMDIQISGIRKHYAVCVTEGKGGAACGARSSLWDNPMQPNAWIRAHSEEEGHTKFRKHTEEDVATFTKPARK